MTNYQHNGEDERQAARRTANALGQTEGEERAAVERELAESPAARHEAADVEQLAARLQEAARALPPVEPSAALREAVERRLTELEMAPSPAPSVPQRRARPWWRQHMAALALTAACLVVLAVPVARSLNLFGPAGPQIAKQSATGRSAKVAAAAPSAQEDLRAKVGDIRSYNQNVELFEKFDMGAIDDAPPAEMSVDPTLEKPADYAANGGSNFEPGPGIAGPGPGYGPGPSPAPIAVAPTRRKAVTFGDSSIHDAITEGAGNGYGQGSGDGSGSGDGDAAWSHRRYDKAALGSGIGADYADAMGDRNGGGSATGQKDLNGNDGGWPYSGQDQQNNRQQNNGDITKSGNGALTLSGSNAYAGTTTISGGVLAFGPGSQLNGQGQASQNGGQPSDSFQATEGEPPIVYPDANNWKALTQNRAAMNAGTAQGEETSGGRRALFDDLPLNQTGDSGSQQNNQSGNRSSQAGDQSIAGSNAPNLSVAPGSGGSGAGFGSGGGRRQRMLATGGGTRHTERAVSWNLVWLANHQAQDGHWSTQHFDQHCIDKSCTGQGEVNSDTAATALGLLPYLAAGQTHKSRGAYKQHIGLGIDWLLVHQQSDGNLAQGSDDPVVSQGLATIALSEAYGLSGDRQVGIAAQSAVDFIVKTQVADGGWRYSPQAASDTSLVGWNLMALKSAHMAGLTIGDSTFARTTQWLDSVATNHGIEYAAQPGLASSPEMTAVGLVCRQYLGATRDDPRLRGGEDYMLQHLPDERSPNVYSWYMGTQFLHNMNDYSWDTWNRKVRDVLVHSQARDENCAKGSWSPEKDPWGKRFGRVGETALASLTLETYYRYLPLFKADADVAAHKNNEIARVDPPKPGEKAGDLMKAEKKPDAPKKPVESWKPARVVPNCSRLMVGDKEQLPLKGMQVDVRIDGFRARVLLDLYYLNDREKQLEGNFQLRLPDEAAPYFFAFGRTVYQAPQPVVSESMFFKPQEVSLGDTTPEKILALRGNSWEQPKVARMVPKEKAAMAYRDTVRRRIDPALVEWSGAGVFQCRVFPLAAQSLHRVTIGYDVDLVRVGDDLELRLDLPDSQSNEPGPATVVDLNVSAADVRQVSLDAPATQSAGGRLSYRLVDPKDRPLNVRLRKPGTLMLAGNDDATGGYFATRVTLPLPEQGAGSREQGASKEQRAKQAVFLVDTSLGAGPQFNLWTKMLRATLENNRDQIKEFAVLYFNVETFWWQEKYVPNTAENVEAAINYADNLALEGATDLGRALQEAAAPKWQKAKSEASPDLFLLSDGAATWGEDRWGLLAGKLTHNTLTPDPSPKGRGEKGSALFAYRTGMAGGDARLLGYLAQRTGGAVFSLVGEQEIAAASVAHRNRPWKLTGIEMAGSHDLLVAGRPQYVFPGQQLTIVGRMESAIGGSRKLDPPYLTFNLQQGAATQTIKVAMDQVLPSELAARTFGQVATSQLEDIALTPSPSPNGRGEDVEPVATAYARHFRITGRTCSLLMLESEADYARFNIKPEEDSFVVKERPADAIVSKAIADAVAAMSDPKATFLNWYRRTCEASEVRFDLPASLKVFIDGLPEETFAVAPQPLACKLRLQSDLPENLRQPWRTGLPDYDTLDAEAQRRLASVGPDDALRCLSSLVAERPGDAALARDLAFTAIDWQRPGDAYHLLRRAASARTFEPITFHAMAHCLEQMGQTDLAIVYYELACGGQWDQRFGDMHNIALLDYARFLRRVVAANEAAGKGDSPIFARAKIGTVPAKTGTVPLKSALPGYAESRLATLASMNLRDTADVAALIFWNTDGTDVDLHVIEPSGEECFYQHTQTASGGHISRDVTTGYGPELYLLPRAPSGLYNISAHYFATDANRATTRTKVLALVYENWGTKDERCVVKSLALTGNKERHDLATVKR